MDEARSFQLNKMSNFALVTQRIFNSGAILLFGKILQIILIITLARYMGSFEFGIFSIVLASAQFSSFIFIIGGQQGLTKITTRLFSTQKYDELTGVLIFVLFTYLIIIGIFSFLNFFFKDLSLFQENNFFTLIVFLTSITLWTVIREGVCRGFSFIGVAQIPHEIISPLMILIFLFFDTKYLLSANEFIFLWFFCHVFVEVLLLIYLFLRFNKVFKNLRVKFIPIKWLQELLPIQISNFTKVGVLRTDVIATGIFLGPASAGLYSIAQKLAQPITLVARTIFAATGYLTTKFYENKKYVDLYNSIKLSSIYAFIGSFIYVAIIFFAGKFILNFVNEEYLAAFSVLIILTIALSIDTVFSPYSQFLLICGYAKILTIFNLIGFLIYLLIMYIFASDIQATIIASSVLVALFFINFASGLIAYKKLKQLSYSQHSDNI